MTRHQIEDHEECQAMSSNPSRERMEPVNFRDLRPGDRVETLAPPYPGQVIGSGVVARIVECKDHTRAVDESGTVIARSDYPNVYRQETQA